MPKNIMLITVGTGRYQEDIAHAINCSIRQHNPDEIFFFVTKESEERTLPLIEKNHKITHTIILDNAEDLTSIINRVEQEIQSLPKENTNLTVDYTSGTKPMSAGIIFATLKFLSHFYESGTENITISYISGERGKDGKVIPGTEKIVSFSPNEIYISLLIEEFVKFFNNLNFDASLTTLEKIKNLIIHKPLKEKVNIFILLTEAYSCWNKFDLITASEKLNQFFSKLSENKIQIPPELNRKIKENQKIIETEKNEKFCFARIFDLLQNAKRCAEEYRYDDATARLYRLIEYIAQFRINDKYHLYNENEKDKSTTIIYEKLPENLKELYKSKSENGELKLALKDSYQLLSDLKDKLGEYFIQQYNEKNSKIKNLLGERNNSILAHGFDPVKKDEYYKLEEFVENFINKLVEIYKEEAPNPKEIVGRIEYIKQNIFPPEIDSSLVKNLLK